MCFNAREDSRLGYIFICLSVWLHGALVSLSCCTVYWCSLFSAQVGLSRYMLREICRISSLRSRTFYISFCVSAFILFSIKITKLQSVQVSWFLNSILSFRLSFFCYLHGAPTVLDVFFHVSCMCILQQSSILGEITRYFPTLPVTDGSIVLRCCASELQWDIICINPCWPVQIPAVIQSQGCVTQSIRQGALAGSSICACYYSCNSRHK